MNGEKSFRLLLGWTRSIILCVGLIFLVACSETKADIKIMAAASLSDAFIEISEAFEAKTGLTTSIYTAGSSTLATQISEGAQANVVALANEETMQRVVNSGQVMNDQEIQIFATNHLVLVTPPGNPASISSIENIDGKKIAVCAPVVPCGSLAYSLAIQEGIELAPSTIEPNVRSVRTKVELGEVDAGLIYITDVTDGTEVIDTPRLKTAKTKYPITVLKPVESAAEEFVDFVMSETGQAILGSYGFGTVYED